MTCPLYFSGKILRDFFPVFFFSPFDKEISFLSKTLDVSKTLREQQSQACCVWIHSFKIYSTADVIVITMQCVHLKFCWLCKWTPPNKSFRYFYNLCFFIQTSQKQQCGCGFIWEKQNHKHYWCRKEKHLIYNCYSYLGKCNIHLKNISVFPMIQVSLLQWIQSRLIHNHVTIPKQVEKWIVFHHTAKFLKLTSRHKRSSPITPWPYYCNHIISSFEARSSLNC